MILRARTPARAARSVVIVLACVFAASAPWTDPGAARATQTASAVFLPFAGHRGTAAPHPREPMWEESNVGLASWGVVGMHVDHSDAHQIYALTRSHGLYRSSDAGRHWVADNAGLPPRPNVSMGHTHGNLLTMDPNHGDVLYANFGGRPHRYRRGEGWVDIGNGIDVCDGQGVVGIVVDPQDSKHVFAAHIVSGCAGGIHESWDADVGADMTWAHIASWSGSGAMENDAWTLAIDPSDASRLFSAPPYLGFLYSTDGGRYWRRDTPLGEGRRGASVVVVHPAITNRVIVGHAAGVHVGEYEASGDTLQWTWLDRTKDAHGYVWDIDIAPSDASKLLLASTDGLFGSDDGGRTWHAVGDHRGLFAKTVAFDPRDDATVYVGSGNGVFRSTDGGATLTDVTGAIPPEMEVQATAISSLDPRVYYCNLHGVAFCRSLDRGEAWDCISNDTSVTRSVAIAVDVDDPQTVYAGLETVNRSADGGVVWTEVLDPGPGRQFFDFQMAADGRLWAAAVHTISSEERYAELYVSSIGGADWEGPLDGFTHRSISVGPIAIAPDDAIYVASYDYVRRSTDGGRTWARLVTGLSGHRDDKWVDGLAVDPTETTRLYLASRSHRVHRSTDGGDTWELVDGNAPMYPGRVIVDHADPGVLYVFGPNGWRRYEGYGTLSEDLPTRGIHAAYTNFRRTALQDPLDDRRFVTGDSYQGFLAFEMKPDRPQAQANDGLTR